jgi:hypothetical protein
MREIVEMMGMKGTREGKIIIPISHPLINGPPSIANPRCKWHVPWISFFD